MSDSNVAHPPGDHTLRRLEAFSDIVIAFSLSQLAFTLQIPRDNGTLLAHPAHIVAFLEGFFGAVLLGSLVLVALLRVRDRLVDRSRPPA